MAYVEPYQPCPECGVPGLHFCVGRRAPPYAYQGPQGRTGLRRLDDWEVPNPCRHPEHNPPNMIVLENGSYEYTCPGCGECQAFRVERGTL